MTTTAARAPSDTLELVLDARTCLELLDRCPCATLACTVKALPSVMPVTVRVTGSAILLVVDRAATAERLAGQIVALGAGVPATLHSAGWWVVIRGELRAQPDAARTLVLAAQQIEGRVLPADPQRG